MSATRKKIILLSILYVVTAMVLLLSADRFSADVAADQPTLLSQVPQDVGSWKGVDLDEKMAKDLFLLKDPTYFKALVREYSQRPEGSKVLLTSLEDLKGFQREVHDPRFCYESRGWTVESYKDVAVSTGSDKTGTMMLLTYANKTTPVKRMELFGYLLDGAIFTSEMALRFGHIRNKLKNMARLSGGHVIYLSLSSDLTGPIEPVSADELKSMMEKILIGLNKAG